MKNLSDGSCVVPYGWMDGWIAGQTCMTKFIVTFYNFMNAP